MDVRKEFLILVFSEFVQAEVILDGSLGRAGALTGPNYAVTEELGKPVGNHLFHSFSQFNINTGESVTFSGSPTVQTIISRVTGGDPSHIDGLIRSTIPNADLYLLNPYGIFFGKNAQLDVQGGFHASTADYLRLSDGGRFEARQPNNSLLTVAPVASFGFLTDSPAAITIENSRLVVPTDKTFSLIGGNIRIQGERLYFVDGEPMFDKVATLMSPEGRLNLASVSSRGEVTPTDNDLLLSNGLLGGQLEMKDTLVDVSGQNSGSVYFRAGQLRMNNSVVLGFSFEDKETGLLNEESGIFNVEVPDIQLTSAIFATKTYGTRRGGDMKVKTDQISVKDGEFAGGGFVSTTSGSGQSGNILIYADTITLSGRGSAIGNISEIPIAWEKSPDYKLPANFGTAGRVEIQATRMTLTDGGLIMSYTSTSGGGGQISVKVTDTLTLSGVTETQTQRTEEYQNIPMFFTSSIISDSRNPGDNAGESGHIRVEAGHVVLRDGGQISSDVYGGGTGHEITVRANSILATGQRTTQGGHVFRSGITTASHSEESYAGNAGAIDIEAETITLTEGGKLVLPRLMGVEVILL